MPYDKIDELYDALKKDGAVSKSRENFRGKMLAPGKEGYENRLQLYNALKADGAVSSPTYEEFSKRLGMHAVNNAPAAKPAAQPQGAAPAQGMTPVETETPPKDAPMTDEAKRRMIAGVGGMVAKTAATGRRAMNRIGYSKAKTGLNVPRVTVGDSSGSGGVRLGQNARVAETEPQFNPETGKMEKSYLTESGNEYTSRAEADLEQNLIDEEASRPLGIDMDESQVEAEQKPANAAAAALWQEAEARHRADREKNAKDVYGGSAWLHAGREMHTVDAAENAHRNEVSRLTRFDLQKMMDDAWGRVGEGMTASCYRKLQGQYPGATDRQLRRSAEEMARRLSDNAVYKYAVAKNTPKSTLEFFAKTAADTNLLRSAARGMARSEAGTTGDLDAEEAAMAEYGKKHRVAQIGGTVAGMMFDPTTYLAGGVGSLFGKGALSLGGRLLFGNAGKGVAARLFGSTLAGRVAGGAAGGAGNFAAYEGIKEAENQWKRGGHVNPKTGENEGYSARDVLASAGRGLVLGGVTGTVSPMLGNVADKWVKATSNTAGKVGIRAGELATSTVAEGTIFSSPEWIENSKMDDGDPNKRGAWDVWTDNMAMMLGFKTQHAVKSAPRVIAGLRPVAEPKTMAERNRNRMSFMERLRNQMDGMGQDKTAFTREEREELRENGYGDLARLFTDFSKKGKTKDDGVPYAETERGRGTYKTVEKPVYEAHEADFAKSEFDGYEEMERLMQDPNVSQAARAKAYYVLTGRQLPMSTVVGYTTDTDQDGNILVKAVTADGETVTSRRFKDEASAKREQEKIRRQAELNSVDVGERYAEAKAENAVWEAAVGEIAPGADVETVRRNYQAAKEGDRDATANYGEMFEAIDRFMEENRGMADGERPEAIRAAVKEETGADVDAAVKKEPGKRTEAEQKAVEEYLKRLFPEKDAGTERPVSDEEAEASAIYDRSRLLWGRVEEGDPEAKADIDEIGVRMREARDGCEEAFGAEAEVRMAEMEEDPWAVLGDPELTEFQQDAALYYINAKAALDGVRDASDDALENKRREVAASVERRTHKDSGTVVPATMKVGDRPVYIVKGNVSLLDDVQDENQCNVNVRSSDKSIIICDAGTGEYEYASPDKIQHVGNSIDPRGEFEEAYARIEAEHEAMLGGGNDEGTTGNDPETTGNDRQPVTEEQLRQYAQGAFNGATQGEDGVTLPQGQAEKMQDYNRRMLEQGQRRKEEEAGREPTALSRVPINSVTGEPMFEATDKETALAALDELTGGDRENTAAIVNAQVDQAQKALDALKKKLPAKKAPALKGSPMAMLKAQQEADAGYNAAMEEYNAKLAEAEGTLRAWSRIYALMNERRREAQERQRDEQRAIDARRHDEGVAQVAEQKRIAAKKAAEQAETGAHAVSPKIRAKWDAAPKVEGNANALTLADVLNSGRPSDLRKFLATYNNEAASPAGGQIDMFSGGVTSKEELLNQVNEYFRNATPREQQAAVDAAIAGRKRRAEAAGEIEDGSQVGGENPSIATENVVSSQERAEMENRITDWLSEENLERAAGKTREEIFEEFGNELAPIAYIPAKHLSLLGDDVKDPRIYCGKGYFIDHALRNHGGQGTQIGIDDVDVSKYLNIQYVLDNPDHIKETFTDGKRTVVFIKKIGRYFAELTQVEEDGKIVLHKSLFNQKKEPYAKLVDIRQKDASSEGGVSSISHADNAASAISLESRGDAFSSEPGTTVSSEDKVRNNPSDVQEKQGKTAANEGEKPLSARIGAASEVVNTEPTEAQKEAGNYKKGHVQVGTFDITIEQPQGSVRKGTDADGRKWESKMHNTYGYFRGTEGVDGDHIDVFLSNDIDGWNGRRVYVVDQYNPDGSFDEHKVMLGFNDIDEAKGDYLANYESGWEDGRRIDVSAVNLDDFEKWIDSSRRKTKPFAEYAGVKKETVASSPAKADTKQAESKGYSIAPSTYTNKKGKTSDVSLLTFDHDLTTDQERAVKEFAKERTGEGRFTPARGWKDRESGGWMFRHEEDARKAAEIAGNADAVADNQPLTAQELREAVEPKKPTSRKAAVKKPTNKVDAAVAPNAEVQNHDWSQYKSGDIFDYEGYKVMFRHVEREDDGRVTGVAVMHLDGDGNPMEYGGESVPPLMFLKQYKAEKPRYEVSDEEMKGLMDDIRDILGIGNDEGDGVLKFRDPDELTAEQRQKLMSVGQRLAMAMVERGNEAFGDYASAMVRALGDKVRPWLKAFYGGLEYVPGYDRYALTPYAEVKAFDVENFDKRTKSGIFAEAQMIAEEGKAQAVAAKANSELKEIRNERRKEADEQRAADTAALAAKTETDISEAETDAETSGDRRSVSRTAGRVDDALDKVSDRLALLGYYEADEKGKDFNEAYGYMRNAEKKAVKDAANLANQLIDDLGLDRYEATHSDKTDKKGNRKTKPLAVANIAPAGGDITMHLPLEEGRALYVNVQLQPSAARGVTGYDGDNLEVTSIMCRVENPGGSGSDRYGQSMWFAEDVPYDELVANVRRVAKDYLPKREPEVQQNEDIFQKAERIAGEAKARLNAERFKPVGNGAFGDVYDQFKGKAKEAFDFLLEHKNGDLRSVFHREDVGDIDLVWGNEDMGVAHILSKHVGEGKDFATSEEAFSMIEKIIDEGGIVRDNENRYVIELNGYRVGIRKDFDGEKKNWVVTAIDYNRSKEEKGIATNPTSASHGVAGSEFAAPNNTLPEGKVTTKSPAKQAKTKKKLKPEQKVGDLFAGLHGDEPVKDNENENGLERNRGEIRPKGVRADNSGERGRRGSQGDGEGTPQEGGRPDRRGERGGQGSGGEIPQGDGRPDGRLQGLGEPKNTRNNRSERGADHAPKTANARIEANVRAIELAHELLGSGETATPEQMAVLRQFSGWGGLGGALDYSGSDWKMRERNRKICELLGEEAYGQAVLSTKSAYYTPANVVDTLWDIARQLGFKGGSILEGSAGIGNILGQMPAEVSGRSDIHAIEIDSTSGGILSLLYPDAKVDIQGFEETRIPNGSVDLAITNVPFVTDMHVKDKSGDLDLSRKFRHIHDFCIAKNVRKLREGGLGIFITSNGTLDGSKTLRDWVVNEGGSDFIGAFRMNNKTFGGTPVTSDIIVIRKRVNGRKSAQAIDVSEIGGERTAEFTEPGGRAAKKLPMDYNRYFVEHPDHMAGEMRFGFEEGDKTYRPTSKGLYPVSGKDQGKMLADFVKSFTEESGAPVETAAEAAPDVYEDLGEGVKEGSMVIDGNGNICTASHGKAVPMMSERKKGETVADEELVRRFHGKKIKGHTKQECFKAYSAIKAALADVMKYQTENEDNAGLEPLIAKLNKAYDDFVNTYGHFNKNSQLAWLRGDVDYPNVFSLETYKEQGDGKGGVVKTYGKADVMEGRVVEKESEPHPENVKDGVVVSMFKNGRIDIPYITGQLGKSEEAVKREIIDSGLGFEDPATRQMEVSYQYLSGNVREKLRQAEANNGNGEYSKNIKALQEVVPMDIPAHLIDFTLGSSWLDPKLYDEYVKDRTGIDVRFTAAGGTWFMKAPSYGTNVEKNRAMGVVSELLKRTVMGHELIEAAIQNRTITVSSTKKHYDGTTETITDREATAACAAKVDEIRQDFKDWARQKMQGDAELSARVEKDYNDRFNNYVPMRIPDEFVPKFFGGATHKFTMRPHQGKAIVRGTMQPLLLAHEVGTGKTFTLISTAMEMRRLGTARKPMIVVQNATVGQFAASAKELYPNAKILTLEDGDRNAEGRKNFYAKIKYNDWDMIVVPQSTFEFIPDSEERQMQFVQDKIDEKMLVLEQMREADGSGRDPVTKRAEKELDGLRAELAALTESAAKKRAAGKAKREAVAKQNAKVRAQEMLDRRTDDVENFDDMGIDALLIDEAHEYKHLGFSTAMQRGVKGVDPSFSKKSQGVYLKTQAVLEKMGGRNVIFATGTPISNTAAEIWTFMRYLMPKDTMKEYGIYYFDDFVRNFGNIQQMPEFKTSGKFQEVNRFAGYVNLPELVRIWSGAADTVLTKDQEDLVKKIPAMEGGKAQDIYLPQTRALRSVMKYVRKRLEEYEKMSGKEKKENSSIPLTMYGIAQGAAVDARLVQADAEDDPNSKTNEAVRQTLRSLKETDGYKGTVAIFADHYMNKRSGFNLYEDIRQKLIAQGVPANEVVVMKPGMTIKKKLDIFDKVNRGEVRVILGSTATLGTGVNIQERLHTLIHLDAPNRPMDYTQRNGRILRQGNLHKEWDKPVRVLRFGVEDSLDVTAYQRLKTKGAIADSVMEGDRLMRDSMNNRVLEEEEDVFGDTVAQLSGSEYALLKNNAEKNVRKYESRRKQWEADQTYIHNAKPKLEGQIKAAERTAEEANARLLAVQEAFPGGKFTEITAGKHTFATVEDMADFIKEHNKKVLDAVKTMKEKPGSGSQTSTLTLSLGGYDFAVKTELWRETVSGGGTLFSEVHRTMTYSCPELGLEDVPVKQALLRNAVEDITGNVITGKDFAERFDTATRAVEHGKSELEQLMKREGKPFEFSRELEEAKRQLEEYTEAMKEELAEKEKKYAAMDASVEAATDVVADDEDETPEDKTKFRLLEDDDPKAMELEALPDSELVPVYRNVQAFEDDALGSPMAFTDAGTGERRTLRGGKWNYSNPPQIQLTVEQQKLLAELNRNGYITVDGKKTTELRINDGLKFIKPKTKDAQLQYFLKKNPEDKGLWAAYDPYDHAIETPLNTQFGEAYRRPNLVVVRSLIPKSEIDEPYYAEYALLPTGAHQWNNGRTLYLSRWSKIDKVLTRAEEAKMIDEYWKKNPGKREALKSHRDYNRFVPQVRRELEKMGYRFELDGKELTPEESRALDKQNWESRDVIPGQEGQLPFISNEDIARINAKMSGKWVGEPKVAMENAMAARVEEMSERLHTPVRIIRTEEDAAALPSARQRRMKGSFNPLTGEVTIVVPNNANLADVENTFIHEVVGHDGLRVLFPEEEKLNNALDELYRASKDEIRNTIDRMAQKMYDAEVGRIRERKRREHEAKGEDANASYYADMAEAHAEASRKRGQFRRDATEEYGADLAGRIGEKGFEKMSAEELTFWGKLKAMLQKALQKLLAGLKIPGKKKWSDKEWAFVLHAAYKRKKNGGNPTVFDAADTEVMRRKTGFGETGLGGRAANEELDVVNERFNERLGTLNEKNADKVVLSLGRPSEVLRLAGVEDKPMKLYGNKVMKKMRKHGFTLDELRDLPHAVADPIAVFNNYGEGGNRSILTELHTANGNFLVTISLGKGKDDIDFNIVSSVFGKGEDNIVDWLNRGLATYINKEKALNYLHHSALRAVTSDSPRLSSAAKVVKDFVNPKVSDENTDKGIMFRDGDMGLDETITQMKIAASQANADNWQAKQDAMKAIGGNLNKLRQAMARQREYDLSTVKSITDLAKVLLDKGLLDDLSKHETKRILTAVNNAHGKQDTGAQVTKVMDIMVDNQLRMGANMLGKLLSVRGSRVDARGIEVQGQLDPDGQAIAQVVRKAISLPKEDIGERIAEALNRMGSDDKAVADEASLEYSGLLLARQYVEDITGSKAEEKALRDSIKQAKEDLDAGKMDKQAYREYVDATEDAIRQNKIERAEAYRSIAEQVGGVLGESVERAKQWREAEKRRVEDIHHNANSDMEGRPTDEHHKESKAQKIANNSAVRFLLAPLGTFDQMLRMFGKKSVNGEGYLWNRYMRGWTEATEKEYKGYQKALETLDEKVSEVFGKKMKWGDLFAMERKMPKATVTFWDGGEQKAHELAQGNLLYIYMVDKMADGRMKLRRMGITEEDVEDIKNFVDPRFLELADWMQDEFLVGKRNEYNEVHKRMFGASMAAIENYFPLKILANARIEDVDVAGDTADTALPATSTGSIIKRRRNNLALDVTGADAFHVILDHIQQMERWAAFAEFNRDLNTLLSYKRFRNQVMNMSSAYGGGKTLWNNFRNVCSMAAGAYRPPIAALDKAAMNFAKGVTAAKVSFRVFTALKQFLSMPAYLSDSNPIYLAANIANPIGAWKWCMENLPLFEKRWKSRMAGDPRLMKSEMDWKMWQNRVVEIASRIGMSPNAFVDAVTVAIGTEAMYRTKKKKYLRYGYDEETAEKRAKQDATILFNQTQQSSESAFLSTMQVDRSWLSVLFTVFRNSSMSYTRQLYDALRNIKHRLEPGYKGLSEEFMAKQMRRDGIDPDKADANAKSEYRRGLLHDIARIAVFGYILQFAWNLGSYLPYLIFGKDEDEKGKMWDDTINHTMFGSIEGLTGGDVMSMAGEMWLNGDMNMDYLEKDMPLASDIAAILNKLPKDMVAAMNDVVNLLVQSGVGVNPQSLTDAAVAIIDYSGGDAQTSRECAMLIARILNCPQSQIDKIYFDELDATAGEAAKMTPAEIAGRYAEYKLHRNAPLTGWAYSEEKRDRVKKPLQNRALTRAKEKLDGRVQTEEARRLLSAYDSVAKRRTELSKLKRTDRAAYREGMKQLLKDNDMKQYGRMWRYKHDMKTLTEKYLRSKDAAERDGVVKVMFSAREKMLRDIERMKRQ